MKERRKRPNTSQYLISRPLDQEACTLPRAAATTTQGISLESYSVTYTRATFDNLALFSTFQDDCTLKEFDFENATFTPGTCGYLCPTKSVIKLKPRFVEYKVMWPNRAAGLGIAGSNLTYY